MSFPSPTGDPENNKHLWWRCVFIAAGIQPVLILLYFIFRSTAFGIILLVLYYPFIALVFDTVWQSVEQPDVLIPFFFWALLPVCFALYSFILGTIFYLVYWLKEKDF